MDQAALAMTILFNSSNATEIVSQMVVNMAGPEAVDEDLTLTTESIKNYLGDGEDDPGIFNVLLEKYQNPA